MNQDVRSLSIIYEHMKHDHTIAKIVVINDGKVLLMQKPDSFEWELPGGHVEPGEKTKQGALREFKEETGFALEPNHLNKIETQYSSDAKLRWYSYFKPVHKVKLSDEHVNFKWVPKKKLDKFTLTKSTNKLIITSTFPQ